MKKKKEEADRWRHHRWLRDPKPTRSVRDAMNWDRWEPRHTDHSHWQHRDPPRTDRRDRRAGKRKDRRQSGRTDHSQIGHKAKRRAGEDTWSWDRQVGHNSQRQPFRNTWRWDPWRAGTSPRTHRRSKHCNRLDCIDTHRTHRSDPRTSWACRDRRNRQEDRRSQHPQHSADCRLHLKRLEQCAHSQWVDDTLQDLVSNSRK